MRVKSIAAAALVALSLSACSQASLNQPVSTAAVSDVQIALDTYQAALGAADVALRGNPALRAKVDAAEAKAAPYIALVQKGTTDATTAPSLGALGAQLLIDAAPYISVVPSAK